MWRSNALAAVFALWAGIANAAPGDIVKSYSLGSSGTATFTSASPTVVTVATWATPTSTLAAQCVGAGIQCVQPIYFTNSGGALPTGITSLLTYYIDPSSISGTSFKISDTAAHALAGTNHINTSSAGTGTQTARNAVNLVSTTAIGVNAINIPVGEWMCDGTIITIPGTGTTTQSYAGRLSVTEAVATSAGVVNNDYKIVMATVPADGIMSLALGPKRVSATAPSTQYLNALATFDVSTLGSYGIEQCTRVQ